MCIIKIGCRVNNPFRHRLLHRIEDYSTLLKLSAYNLKAALFYLIRSDIFYLCIHVKLLKMLLIEILYILPCHKRILHYICAIKILFMHIDCRYLMILICCVVIYALVRITA